MFTVDATDRIDGCFLRLITILAVLEVRAQEQDETNNRVGRIIQGGQTKSTSEVEEDWTPWMMGLVLQFKVWI